MSRTDRRPSQRIWPIPSRSRGEPAVPMINVVFLLLAFFLMTAHFADTTAPGDSRLNVGDAPAPGGPVLILEPAGRVTYGSLHGPDAITAAAGAPGRLRVRTSRETEAAHLARLLTALARAGAGRVDLVPTSRATP